MDAKVKTGISRKRRVMPQDHIPRLGGGKRLKSGSGVLSPRMDETAATEESKKFPADKGRADVPVNIP
jgi:hypothetical protein